MSRTHADRRPPRRIDPEMEAEIWAKTAVMRRAIAQINREIRRTYMPNVLASRQRAVTALRLQIDAEHRRLNRRAA